MDYLYASNMSSSGLWTGEWGLFRSCPRLRDDLAALLNSLVVRDRPIRVVNANQFARNGLCPNNAQVRAYRLRAVVHDLETLVGAADCHRGRG